MNVDIDTFCCPACGGSLSMRCPCDMTTPMQNRIDKLESLLVEIEPYVQFNPASLVDAGVRREFYDVCEDIKKRDESEG